MATINVPTSDGKTLEKTGFVYWYTMPSGKRHKFFIQDGTHDMDCVLVDWRSGFVVKKLYEYLLPYVIDGYKVTRNLKREASDTLMREVLIKHQEQGFLDVVQKAPTLNK